MGNPVPTQVRSIDPYASYNSDIASRITRIVTDGLDCLLSPSPINLSIVDPTSVLVIAGKAVKDDILIEVSNITIDLVDSDFYADSGGGVWNETGYYYVVLDYTYSKARPAPEASVKVILPSQRTTHFKSTTDFVFIKCLEVSNPGDGNQVDAIFDFDPEDNTVGRIIQGNDQSINPLEIDGGTHTIPSSVTAILASGNATINLPPVDIFNNLMRIIKVDAAPNIINVIPDGSDTIEDLNQIQLLGKWDDVTLLPDQTADTWVEI